MHARNLLSPLHVLLDPTCRREEEIRRIVYHTYR